MKINQLPEPELGYIKTDKSNQPAFSARQMREAQQPATGEPVNLQHMAVAENGALRWMTGRKVQNCELYAMPDFGRAPTLYTTQQPAQATQADVTDEQILSLDCVSIDSDEHGTSFWVDRSTVVKFARAILALRPERVPMTYEQRQSAFLSAPTSSGGHRTAFMLGIQFAEAHHGITAQAKKETP